MQFGVTTRCRNLFRPSGYSRVLRAIPGYNVPTGCPIRKLFHFESPRERYKCDAAIVWCFDNRFELALRKLIKRLGIIYFDPIRVAGGANAWPEMTANPTVNSCWSRSGSRLRCMAQKPCC